MKKNDYICTVYGVYQPTAQDRIFYYSGEIIELHGDSIMDVTAQYEALTMKQEGTVKATANIFHGSVCVGTVSSEGFEPPADNWVAANRKAKAKALQNAEELGIDLDTITAIQRGNLHEISFFSDSRVHDWLGSWKVGEQVSLFDARYSA